ncbi:MAG: hypothetical protein QOF37_2798 [Thermoleophilaceae bacterium]|nr:hypothetical protein [Thermoleophilaceae bacterium]
MKPRTVKRALAVATALVAALPAPALAGPDPVNQPLRDGCQRNPGGLLSYSSPEWVFVGGDEQATERVVEGIATLNHTADEDLPQSHFSYDLDSDVVPDPQYADLLAGTAQAGNGNYSGDADKGKLHVEWESGAIPAYAWPSEGDRVKYWGHWVWDCGHWGQGIQVEQDNPEGSVQGTGDYFLPGQFPALEPQSPEGLRGEQTELHPLEAVAVNRVSAWQSPSGERETDVFMSDQGTHALAESRCAHDLSPPTPLAVYGPDFTACVNSGQHELQDLRGRSFQFHVPAPPRPSPGAQLAYREVDQLKQGTQWYSEQVTERPDGIDVTVTFDQHAPTPLAYGKSWFAGWDRGAAQPTHLKLTVKSITVVHSLDPNPARLQQSGPPPGEYNLYLDVNGYWNFIGGSPPLDTGPPPQWAPALGAVRDGQVVPVNHAVDFFVPAGAPVRLDVSGRECDLPRMEPCFAHGEVSDGNDHPGQAIVSFPSSAASLGDHRVTSPLGHWFMDYSVAQEASGGPSPPGTSGVSTSQPSGTLGGRGTVVSQPGGGLIGGCLDRVAPRSGFARTLRASRRRIALKGSARDLACSRPGRVSRVTIALARRTGGGRCRYLQPSGRFGPVTGCRRPTYVTARGRGRFALSIRGPLSPGVYLARSRAIDAAGNVERKHRLHGRLRNFATLRL